MAKITKEAALLYHSQGKPGKIEVVPYQTLQVHKLIYHLHTLRRGRALPRNREESAGRLQIHSQKATW